MQNKIKRKDGEAYLPPSFSDCDSAIQARGKSYGRAGMLSHSVWCGFARFLCGSTGKMPVNWYCRILRKLSQAQVPGFFAPGKMLAQSGLQKNGESCLRVLNFCFAGSFAGLTAYVHIAQTAFRKDAGICVEYGRSAVMRMLTESRLYGINKTLCVTAF